VRAARPALGLERIGASGWTSPDSQQQPVFDLPHVRVPHLASHLLALVARRINADWQQKYGHGLDWLESSVEVGRFRGTCYQAANWRWVGQTRGRSRYDRDRTLSVSPKAVYLYRLR
jgi:hypothetical protein